MRTVLVVMMALSLAAAGCGNNVCEDAADKLDECGFDLGDSQPSDDEASECNDRNECRSNCLNAASCEDIKAWHEEAAENGVYKCYAACPL